MEQLKNALYAYKDIDNRLNDLNRDVATLRGQRKDIEVTMATILARPELSAIDKLELKDDNSYVRIGRPDTWTKPWSLSKKDLATHLTDYFQRNTVPTPDGCFKYICETQRTLGKEFTFERVKRKNE
jgi:hypothetical protein